MSPTNRISQYIAGSLIVVCLATLPVLAGKLLLWQSLLIVAMVLTAAVIWMLGALPAATAPRPTLIDIALSLFLGLSAISVLGSVYLHDSLVAVGQVVSYILVFWLCQGLGKHSGWRRAVGAAMLAGGLVAAIWGLREYVQTVAAAGDVTWRIFGSFHNPNLLAGYLLLVLPLAISVLWWWGQHREREDYVVGLVAGVLVVVVLAAALLLTGSKGGLLAAGAVVIVLAIALPEPGTRAAVWVRWLAVGGLVVAGGLALALPPISTRVVAAFTTQSHSIAFRYYTWRGTLNMIAARPVWGFGPGSFAYIYPRFAQAGFTRMAHQSYLQIAAESGLPSLIALLTAISAIVLLAIRRLRAASPAQRALLVAALAAVVGFLIHNLVDYSWYCPAVALTLWALLGLAIGASAARAQTSRGHAAVTIAVRVAIVLIIIAGLVGSVIGLSAQYRAAQADSLAQRGLYSQAVQQIKRALQLDPLDAQLYEDLSDYQASRAAFAGPVAVERAVRARCEAARLRPTEPANYRYLAALYAQMGEAPSAIGAARRAVKEYPTYVNGWLSLARLYQQADALDQAEDSYRRIVQLYDSPVRKYAAIKEFAQPAYAYAWHFLADQAAQRNETEQEYLYLSIAAKVLTRYLREAPMLRALHELMGSWDEQQYQRLRSLAVEIAGRLTDSGKMRDLMRAGELYLALDQPNAAQQALEKLALQAEGKSLSAGEKLFAGRGLVSLATLLENQQHPSPAQQVLQQGLAWLREGQQETAGATAVAGWEEDDTQIADYILTHHQLPGPQSRMTLIKEEDK